MADATPAPVDGTQPEMNSAPVSADTAPAAAQDSKPEAKDAPDATPPSAPEAAAPVNPPVFATAADSIVDKIAAQQHVIDGGFGASVITH